MSFLYDGTDPKMLRLRDLRGKWVERTLTDAERSEMHRLIEETGQAEEIGAVDADEPGGPRPRPSR